MPAQTLFSSFSCYTNVKCRNERQRPFGSAKHPQNKQETNYQQQQQQKKKKTPWCKRLLAARNQKLRNWVQASNSPRDSVVAFRKEKSAQRRGGNPPAQRKSVCQPIFPALTAQENASKSIHSTQKRDILGPLSRVSSTTCPVQNKKASLIFSTTADKDTNIQKSPIILLVNSPTLLKTTQPNHHFSLPFSHSPKSVRGPT